MDHKTILFLFVILFYLILMLRSMKLALLVYLFLCPFNIFIPIGAKNINSTEAVALMFIVVWLSNLLRNERLSVPATVFTAPLFFYFLASFILIVNTGLTGDVIIDIIRHFQFFAVFIIFVSYFKGKKDIYAISNTLIASLTVLCFVAILELIFVYGINGVAWQRSILWKKGLIDIGFYPATWLSLKRLAGWSAKAGLAATFPIHHAFGIYLGSLIYLLVWRIFIHRELNMKKIGMLLLLVISFFILIFTKARTPIFAFLLSIPVLLIFLGNWRLRFKIIALIGFLLIAIMIFIPNIIIEQSTDWIEALHKSGFTGLGKGDIGRINYFLGSVNVFFEKPLTGAGYHILKDLNPHAAFMQELVLKGILGGITLIWILYRMFRVSYGDLKKLKHRKSEPAHFLSAAWLLSLTIYLCIASIGVGLFGYVLPSIPAISAMSMFVITRRSFAIEKGSEPLESS
jgi:hypothetical protein